MTDVTPAAARRRRRPAGAARRAERCGRTTRSTSSTTATTTSRTGGRWSTGCSRSRTGSCSTSSGSSRSCSGSSRSSSSCSRSGTRSSGSRRCTCGTTGGSRASRASCATSTRRSTSRPTTRSAVPDAAVVTVDDPGEMNRWLGFVQWLLAFPHYIVLWLLEIALFVVLVINLFIGAVHGPVERADAGLRASASPAGTRGCTAYVFLLTDKYPPFSLPVDARLARGALMTGRPAAAAPRQLRQASSDDATALPNPLDQLLEARRAREVTPTSRRAARRCEYGGSTLAEVIALSILIAVSDRSPTSSRAVADGRRLRAARVAVDGQRRE